MTNRITVIADILAGVDWTANTQAYGQRRGKVGKPATFRLSQDPAFRKPGAQTWYPQILTSSTHIIRQIDSKTDFFYTCKVVIFDVLRLAFLR